MGQPKKFRVVFETDDSRQALRFINLMRRAADRSTVKADRNFWRGLADQVLSQADGVVHRRRHQVVRPTGDDEIAVRRVIKGGEPYPVLSRMDARRVVAHFAHRLSARQLGERLYVDHRTITRWRGEHRKGMWKKYGI